MNNINVVQLNDQNVCVSIKSVRDDYILGANELFSETLDRTILGKTYNPETGTYYFSQESLEAGAKAWRNAELTRTDALMLLPDYPYKERLSIYRQALRDWPSTDAFPDTRPELGE